MWWWKAAHWNRKQPPFYSLPSSKRRASLTCIPFVSPLFVFLPLLGEPWIKFDTLVRQRQKKETKYFRDILEAPLTPICCIAPLFPPGFALLTPQCIWENQEIVQPRPRSWIINYWLDNWIMCARSHTLSRMCPQQHTHTHMHTNTQAWMLLFCWASSLSLSHFTHKVRFGHRSIHEHLLIHCLCAGVELYALFNE